MNTLLVAFMSTTAVLGLPPGLLSAMCFVESSHKINAVHYQDGKGDSLGVCQIKEASAAMVGFKGTRKELMNPTLNVYFAGKLLKHQIDRYNGDLRKAVSAYNAGSHRAAPSGLAFNHKYVGKVFTAWSEDR